MPDFARLVLAADTSQMKTAEASLNRVTAAGTKTESATNRVTRSTNQLAVAQQKTAASTTAVVAQTTALNRALRSNGLRNFGLQMNQVAQQAAAGGGALRALSIQMPDLLLGFGTLGVLAGVAAPSIMSLAGSFFATSNAASELVDDLLDTNTGLGSVRGMIGELKELQDSYSRAIAASANTSSSAASVIAANSKREFDARKQVLEVETQLLRIRAQEQQADLRALQNQAENAARFSANYTSNTTIRNNDAQGFAYQGPRTVSDILGPDFNETESRRRQLAIRKLQAELSLTELAADEASQAIATAFSGGVAGGSVEADIEEGGSAGRGARAAGGAARDAADEFYGLTDAQKAALQEVTGLIRPTESYAAKMGDLNKLLSIGAISQEQYADATALLNDELADSLPLVNDVADAFGDWVARGFRDFKGMVDSIWQSFQRLLSDMVAAAARNQIMLSLGIGGGATAGGIAQAGSGLLGAMGTGAGIAGLAGGTGFMGGLGNALAGGISGAFNIGANAAAAGAGGVATFASTLGAAVPVLGALAAGVALFSTKTKTLDAGLRLTAEGAGLAVKEFEKVQKSRFFGFSKRTYETSGAAAASLADPLKDAYRGIYRGVLDVAKTLNVGRDAIKDFSHTVQISTKGMTEAEASAAIMGELAKVEEKLAKRVLVSLKGTANLVRDGETAAQALARLSTNMQAANHVMDRMGQASYDFTAKGAAAASRLVEMAGGVDALMASTASYMTNILSPDEQLKILRKDFRQALGDLNIGSVPQSREDFQQLLERLFANGRNAAAVGLMGLADEFAQILSVRDQLRDATDAARQNVRDQRGANRDRVQDIRDRFRDRANNLDQRGFSTFGDYRARQVEILTRGNRRAERAERIGEEQLNVLKEILKAARLTEKHTGNTAALTGR